MKKTQDTPHDDNAAERIFIRCTEQDKSKLLSLAGGRGRLSSFMLAASLQSGSATNGKAERAKLIEGLAQLGKIGSNVNQLARAANSGDTPSGYAIELAMQEVIRCAAAIRAELQNKQTPP
jgi:hypothetical protein